MATMDCATARAGLWPPERPKLVGDEDTEARAHVTDCTECTEFFAQDRALLDMYDRIRGEKAPIEVREKVFDALARSRWQTRGAEPEISSEKASWLARLAFPLLAAAALAVITVTNLDRSAHVEAVATPDDPSMFVEDYLRRAVGQDHIETSDPAEVVRFLQRELGLALEPLDVEGLELLRAEICLLEGQRGAMIAYKQNGAAISHYLVPRDGTEPRAPALSDQDGGPGDTQLPVVTWSTGRVEQALVGELSSDQLLKLAAYGVSQQ